MLLCLSTILIYYLKIKVFNKITFYRFMLVLLQKIFILFVNLIRINLRLMYKSLLSGIMNVMTVEACLNVG